MGTRTLSYGFVLALILVPAAVCNADTVIQGAGDDFVHFTAGQYDTLTNPGTSVIVDNGDGTLSTTNQGDKTSVATYQIQFVEAPANYFLYFNLVEVSGDSVFVNHATGFNSVPGGIDDERWNGLDTGWNGLYEILGDQSSNYKIPAGDPAWGWNVAGPSTVSFSVRNREDELLWKDFIFSQHDDLTADDLDTIIGAPADPYVDFTYTQTDAAAGAGTISGTIDASSIGGPTRLEVSGVMPAATVTQMGDIGGTPVPDGMVGFIDGESTIGNPGADKGVHLDWRGEAVTLTGTDGDTLYSVQVLLQYPDEDVTGEETRGSWKFTLTDDNSSVGGTNDAVGWTRLAGWMGDEGDGNRSSGNSGGHDWVAGPDEIIEDKGFSIDQHSWGDNIGMTVGSRDFDITSPLFVDEATIRGRLPVDMGTLAAVPEPTSLMLAAMALLFGGYGFCRRRRA